MVKTAKLLARVVTKQTIKTVKAVHNMKLFIYALMVE